MAWRDARAQIAAILGGVSISTPVVAQIAHVYQTPPPTVQDKPSFVLYPPGEKTERLPSQRVKTYTLRFALYVAEESVEQGADIVDAFREATLDAFDSDLTLGGTCTLIVGPSVEAATHFDSVDFVLTVVIKEPRTFA